MPIFARDEQIERTVKVQKLFKYTHASWPGIENMWEYLEFTSEGNFNLRSTDEEDLANVSLSSNGFQVMCSFLCLLPYKKPQWVEVGDLDRS